MSRWSDPATPRAGGRHGSPWRAAGAAFVMLLAMAGATMVGAGLRTTPPARPPQPPAAAVGATGIGPTAFPADDVAARPPATALPRSAPTTVTIPRIGVDAQVVSLGVNADGTVQVPPLDQAHLAGWYSLGPSPGETGNAVIVGHVDSAKIGPAVFFHLGALQPGDTITVARRDARSATFRVDAVRSYPKVDFPTDLVYGPSSRAGLRVVTCGGQFDETSGDYPDNVVVFATLVG